MPSGKAFSRKKSALGRSNQTINLGSSETHLKRPKQSQKNHGKCKTQPKNHRPPVDLRNLREQGNGCDRIALVARRVAIFPDFEADERAIEIEGCLLHCFPVVAVFVTDVGTVDNHKIREHIS